VGGPCAPNRVAANGFLTKRPAATCWLAAVARSAPESATVLPIPVSAIVVVVASVKIRAAVFVFVALVFTAEPVGLCGSDEAAEAARGQCDR
jgi:hypothetical protein